MNDEHILCDKDELERKLRERTASLEASHHDLSAFVMNLAHDLRAPLRAINGFASRLMGEHAAVLPPEGRCLLIKLSTSASLLGRLMEGHLRLSRLTTAELHAQDVDMARLAREAWEAAVAAEQRPPSLVLPSLPGVRGDESLLCQVWMNLFSNAVKFSRKSAAPKVEVSAQDADDSVRFRVQDNGVGFDPTYRDLLFRPFERLHTQSEFEGTGVGLSIVQRIVQRHGGGVSIDADIGGGAAVEFWLPKCS